jgi:hypothetical protein
MNFRAAIEKGGQTLVDAKKYCRQAAFRIIKRSEIPKYIYQKTISIPRFYPCDFGLFFFPLIENRLCFVLGSIRTQSSDDRPVTQALVLLDLDNFQLRQIVHPPTIAFLLQLVFSFRDLIENYMGACILINGTQQEF